MCARDDLKMPTGRGQLVNFFDEIQFYPLGLKNTDVFWNYRNYSLLIDAGLVMKDQWLAKGIARNSADVPEVMKRKPQNLHVQKPMFAVQPPAIKVETSFSGKAEARSELTAPARMATNTGASHVDTSTRAPPKKDTTTPAKVEHTAAVGTSRGNIYQKPTDTIGVQPNTTVDSMAMVRDAQMLMQRAGMHTNTQPVQHTVAHQSTAYPEKSIFDEVDVQRADAAVISLLGGKPVASALTAPVILPSPTHVGMKIM